MGSPQTVILAAGQPVGFPGLSTLKLDTASLVNAEASLNINFGLGVKPGVKTKEALLPSANNSIFVGVVLWSAVYAPGTFGELDQTSTPPGLIPKTEMTVLQEGRCYVQIDGDTVITPNVTRAFLRFETDGASNVTRGTFRHTDDGHTTDVRGQVLFVGPVFTAADGVLKMAEAKISVSNKA